MFWKDVKNKFDSAYRDTTNPLVDNINNQTKYSIKTLKDGTNYIETENNLFTKKDGTPMTQREIYNSLVGKEIKFNDGIVATIKQWLPNNKNMYNELFKRYPNYRNVKNIKNVNNNINENIIELLENSGVISQNEPDYMNRHKKNKIDSFDTRRVRFFDGRKAYDLDFSIAKMDDGNYVAYAKRNLIPNNKLLKSIKKEAPTSKSRGVLPYRNNISDSKQNVKSDTKYSMQSGEKNSKIIDNKWQNFVDQNFQTEGTGHTLSQLKLNDHNNGVALVDAFNQTNIPKYSISEKSEANVLNAINNKSSKRKIYLGKANNTVVRKVKSFFGIDVSNKRHVLTDNDIRHMLNQHGNDTKITNGKQLDLTKEDIIKIPKIIKDSDNIIKGSSNIDRAVNTNNSIRYIKTYDQNKSYVIEVIPTTEIH